MRKVDGGKRKEKKKKRIAFLVATTSLPAVYRPNGYARTTTAGTPHARAKIKQLVLTLRQLNLVKSFQKSQKKSSML